MKKCILALVLALSFGVAMAQEKVIEFRDVDAMNYGDGRLYMRERGKNEALNGEFRIIDGYRSIYALVNIKNGFYDGEYKEYNREKLSEECNYKEGRLDGMRRQYHIDGKTLRSEGKFINGKMDGRHETFSQQGKLQTSVEYTAGEQNGAERRYNDGRLIVEKFFKNGQPDGNWVEHISSNAGDYTRRRSFINGKSEGEYSEIFEDGRIREKGTYKNGNMHGVWEEYRDSGIIKISTTYTDGEKTGVETIYFTDGKPESSTSYLNGKRDGLRRVYRYDTGKLKESFTYKAGKINGPYARYHSNGQISEEGEALNDYEITRTEYYSNGKKRSEAERKPGNAWTVTKRWDEKGKAIPTEHQLKL